MKCDFSKMKPTRSKSQLTVCPLCPSFTKFQGTEITAEQDLENVTHEML